MPCCHYHPSCCALQDTVVAVRRGGDELVVCNVDAGKYPEQVFSVDPAQASFASFCSTWLVSDAGKYSEQVFGGDSARHALSSDRLHVYRACQWMASIGV